MGNIVALSSFNSNYNTNSQLLIYCNSDNILSDNAVSINKVLAIELSKYRANRRAINLEHCLNIVLAELEQNPVIKDIDVMFNPAYEIDVVRILTSSYRKKEFSVIWSGDYIDGKLQYSEDGFADYKTFDIGAYDITCII